MLREGSSNNTPWTTLGSQLNHHHRRRHHHQQQQQQQQQQQSVMKHIHKTQFNTRMYLNHRM